MQENEISVNIIEMEYKRLQEEENLTDTKAIELLVNVYGSKPVANFLNWYARENKEPQS
jgi:hypothetical protein